MGAEPMFENRISLNSGLSLRMKASCLAGVPEMEVAELLRALGFDAKVQEKKCHKHYCLAAMK